MIEIGATLYEARARRGIGLPDAEKATRLRGRYLRALEEERFDQLPPGSYRRSFLRTYATFLDLDADKLVAEYAARFERHEPADAVAQPVRAHAPRRRRRYGALAVALLVAAVALAGAAVAFVALGMGGGDHPARTAGVSAAAVRPRAKPRSRTHAATAKPAAPATAAVLVRAVGGPCWLTVRRGSAQGAVVYEGTLQQGGSVTLHGARLWARIGAPWNVSLSIGGRTQTLPRTVSDVLLTAHGLASAP